MVLKEVNWGTQCKNQVIWILKGVNRVYNDKIGWPNGLLERSQLGTQYKNKVKCVPWKESIGYTMIKWCQMVLKGVNLVYYNKISSDGLEIESIEYTMIKWCQMVLNFSQIGLL